MKKLLCIVLSVFLVFGACRILLGNSVDDYNLHDIVVFLADHAGDSRGRYVGINNFVDHLKVDRYYLENIVSFVSASANGDGYATYYYITDELHMNEAIYDVLYADGSYQYVYQRRSLTPVAPSGGGIDVLDWLDYIGTCFVQFGNLLWNILLTVLSMMVTVLDCVLWLLQIVMYLLGFWQINPV